MIQPVNWNELVADVAEEVRKGTALDIAIEVVAGDYGARADVLQVRVSKAYPEGIPAGVDTAAQVERSIAETCKRYGVDRSFARGPLTTIRNRKVTVICNDGRCYIAVDMETGEVRAVPYSHISEASLKYAGMLRKAA